MEGCSSKKSVVTLDELLKKRVYTWMLHNLLDFVSQSEFLFQTGWARRREEINPIYLSCVWVCITFFNAPENKNNGIGISRSNNVASEIALFDVSMKKSALIGETKDVRKNIRFGNIVCLCLNCAHLFMHETEKSYIM